MGRIPLGMKLAAAIGLGLFLLLSTAQPARAQITPECTSPNPLCLDNNYFVTGDYVVGAVGLRGLGSVTVPGFATPFAQGTIGIPDCTQAQAINPGVNCATLPAPVPAGAGIVAAWLYWETVESSSQSPPLPPNPGRFGFFKPLGQAGNGYSISGNGYPITGTVLGNLNAPSSWSSGGCVGNNSGAKSIVGYRADVRPYLLEDANGNVQANGKFQVMLPDSGSGATPFTLGATLVVIYRVLSSAKPLNAIVIYDGAFAPSNQTAGNTEMSQTMQGFYEPALNPVAKITHIVGDGKSNKFEQAFFHNQALPFLYPTLSSNAAFPGVYNGSWDTATWDVSAFVNGGLAGDTSETASVVQGSTNAGCVDWGAVIFSTTVQDSDGDGNLEVWKKNVIPGPGYTDAISAQNGSPNPFVALPGATAGMKDIFVEIDYLTDLDGSAGLPVHSHLPKQQALDMVGDAFAAHSINVHFDVGSNYKGNCSTTHPAACPDPYIIQGGTGGNAIPETATLCTDGATLCQFPGTPSVGWKGGYLFVKNNCSVDPATGMVKPCGTAGALPLGNFQFGRKSSYHYVLFGHALGLPRSYWTTFASTLQSSSFAKLISIVNSGTSATVTIQSPGPSASPGQTPAIIKPGDCVLNPAIPACISDLNVGRVTLSGAIGQPALNGTYNLSGASSSPPDANNVITTTFNITTAGLPSGATTYNFSNESRLAVEYLGPSSSSGHSDFPGGADSAVTFGLWPQDDVPGPPPACQADPSMALALGQMYCVNEVGTIQAQAGTLLHEMGHTFTLSHGGIFYPTPDNPNGTIVSSGPLAGQQQNIAPYFVANYGLNCNPAFLSSMNYLFVVRGFPDVLPDGTHPIDYSGQTLQPLSELALNEVSGIGVDMFTSASAPHYTRWYAPPTAEQKRDGQFATAHCDGTPILDGAQMVRVDGNTFSAPIDWDNDQPAPDETQPVPWQDVNFNGSTQASPDPFPPASPVFNDMQGFNDWVNLDLQQVGSRENAGGLSGGGSVSAVHGAGGSVSASNGAGGGPDQDVETACSTADPVTALSAFQSDKKTVTLNWSAPPGSPCQVSTYHVNRSTNGGPFMLIGNVSRMNGALATTFMDKTVQNNNTYCYFVTDTDVQGATSGRSPTRCVTVVGSL